MEPPAYEPPGPEVTGQTEDVENTTTRNGDTFQDEPAQGGEYKEEGDPLKWNFSPTVIIILIVLNLLALGAVGYLIWYAVDQSKTTPAPTSPPTAITPSPSMSPSSSAGPSPGPSRSSSPSIFQSQAPTIFSTPAPSSSFNPTPIASSSPSFAPFKCNLCGDGKSMSTTSLTASIAFGSRVTRTCQELLDDQNAENILEDQCIALYDTVNATCGCTPATAIGARDDAAITTMLQATVGSEINTASTFENAAKAVLLTSDTWFASHKYVLTDDEVTQRYILLLAFHYLGITSFISSDGLLAKWECDWNPVTACDYGQVTEIWFNGTAYSASSATSAFPVDLFNMTYVESLQITDFPISGTIPDAIHDNDVLTKLSLANNQLTGTLPDTMFELRSLVDLDLSNNALTGSLTDNRLVKQLVRLTIFNLGTNALTGLLRTCELTTPPTTMVADCSKVTCSCCTLCADGGTPATL